MKTFILSSEVKREVAAWCKANDNQDRWSLLGKENVLDGSPIAKLTVVTIYDECMEIAFKLAWGEHIEWEMTHTLPSIQVPVDARNG